MLAILVASFAVAGTGLAQQSASYSPEALTAADYEQAEKFLGYNTNPLVYGAGVTPNWLPAERFWYRITTAEGAEFVLVDPGSGTREPAFDHARLAAALSAEASETYEAYALPFATFDLADDGGTIWFDAEDRSWACDIRAYQCTPGRSRGEAGASAAGRRGGGSGFSRTEVASPDGTRMAFIRDHNLWVRNVATGEERPLTRDGVKDYGYGTDNAGWRKSDRPIVAWSPDSDKIATFQQDQRGVGEMYLVDTRVGHPNLSAWKYPLPGDSVVTMIERVVIDVDHGTLVR